MRETKWPKPLPPEHGSENSASPMTDISPDPTAPILPLAEDLDLAQQQIRDLIEQNAADLDELARQLQVQEDATAEVREGNRQALQALEDELARQRQITTVLNQRVADLFSEKEDLTQRLHQSEEKLQMIRNSRSWRLTHRLRRLIRRLRG